MRYRVEIYDANKAHDLTIYSANSYNREALTKLVKPNLSKFEGNVKAYVVDTQDNKKVFAAFFPEEIHNSI
jgi:hypothetical protein